jgi:hypothetical protein
MQSLAAEAGLARAALLSRVFDDAGPFGRLLETMVDDLLVGTAPKKAGGRRGPGKLSTR